MRATLVTRVSRLTPSSGGAPGPGAIRSGNVDAHREFPEDPSAWRAGDAGWNGSDAAWDRGSEGGEPRHGARDRFAGPFADGNGRPAGADAGPADLGPDWTTQGAVGPSAPTSGFSAPTSGFSAPMSGSPAPTPGFPAPASGSASGGGLPLPDATAPVSGPGAAESGRGHHAPPRAWAVDESPTTVVSAQARSGDHGPGLDPRSGGEARPGAEGPVRSPEVPTERITVRRSPGPAARVGEGIYRTRRPAVAILFGLVAFLLEFAALRLLFEGVLGDPVIPSSAVAGICLLLGLPAVAVGLYGLVTGAGRLPEQPPAWAWVRPPVGYLTVGLVLFVAAGLAAGG